MINAGDGYFFFDMIHLKLTISGNTSKMELTLPQQKNRVIYYNYLE